MKSPDSHTVRGSRKHVLDWTGRSEFVREALHLLRPDVEALVTADSVWMPRGPDEPDEARLESFGRQWLQIAPWEQLQDWWLVHKREATTPNWDLALGCVIEGRPGLVLVEAKAHAGELSEGRKAGSSGSERSAENAARIKLAIQEARDALRAVDPAVAISRDSCYQFSNRVAFAWKLAELGIPVALVYLGFLGDTSLGTGFKHFTWGQEWEAVLKTHVEKVFPWSLMGRRMQTGAAPMWVLVRSRDVAEPSPRHRLRPGPLPELSPKEQPMPRCIEVKWLRGPADRYTDVFPLALFENDSPSFETVHVVRGPRGGSLYARCRIQSHGAECDLDYRPFAKQNTAEGIDLGVMSFTFADASRRRVKRVRWDGALLGAKDVKIRITNTDVNVDPAHTGLAKSARQIVRLNQVVFRKQLYRVYGAKCCITGCDVVWALQAAHIRPFSGRGVDRTANGLLLRSDLHALFDANLLAIEPTTRVVHFAGETRTWDEYGDLHTQGRVLAEPQPGYESEAPSEAALKRRWKAFVSASGKA